MANRTVTYRGFKLFEWQKAVHTGLVKKGIGSGHIHCVKSKRQVGKSMLIVGELLYFAINYKNTVNGCISPTLNQSRKLYKEILKSTLDSGVIQKKNDSLLEIEFINGSTILFKSAEQRDSLRGYTYSGLLCIDECAYIVDEVYSIVKPSTDVHRCPILMVSTPKFRVGFFFNTYAAGLVGHPSITSYDFNKYDTSALLSAEALKMYKQMLPKNQFKTEYLGEFLDADGCVFTNFKECVGEAKNSDYKQLYIGIDWATGGGNDDTVITGFNEFGEQVFLKYFNNKNTTQQIDYIVEYLKEYMPMIKCILAEDNSIGTPMVNNLRDRLGNKKSLIKTFTTTNKEKARVINQLQVAFEQNKVVLLDDEKQLGELGMYEATYNPKTGNISYNAPLGGNDDICIALCLAYEAMHTGKNNAQYCLMYI
jgi:hypothetical protein